jgi:phospholipid/cholesterol/gamma-HCH transport system substrate-binding protein
VKISREFKIGVVMVCAIAAFIWGLSFLKGTNLFGRKFYLYALYPKIENLFPANPVQINGYKIGQIKSIGLVQRNGRNLVLVKMLINDPVRIPRHSIARAVSADLLGSKAIEIIFSQDIEYTKDGDTLNAETEQGIKESFNRQIAPLQAKAEKLVGSIDSVMTVVNMVLNRETRENIEQSFASVRRAILSLEQTSYRMNDFITAANPKMKEVLGNLAMITANLNKSEAKINNILANFSAMSDSLAKSQIKSAIASADNSLKELNTLLTKINQGQGTLGKMAKNDSLYNNLNKSAEKLEKLLQDVRMNPKRYVHFSIFGKSDKNKPKD